MDASDSAQSAVQEDDDYVLSDQPEIKQRPARRGRGRPRARGATRSSTRSTRKRDISDSDADDFLTEASSEAEYAPANRQTKSGRTVRKPAAIAPPKPEKPPAKRRRKQADDGFTNAFCTVCASGHSPENNRIVLCDGCNKPFHQLCHDPVVEQTIVDGTETEWFCKDCQAKIALSIPVLDFENTVDGSDFTEEERDAYLSKLSTTSMLEVVHYLQSQAPAAKIYPSNLKEVLANAEAARQKHAQELAELREKQEADLRAAEEAVKEAERLQQAAAKARKTQERKIGQPRSPTRSMNDDDYDPSNGGYEDDEPAPQRYINNALYTEGEPLPSYETMLVQASESIDDPEGCPPKRLFEWMQQYYPVADNFKPSASQALQKAAKKGRFLKNGSLYRLNPNYEGADVKQYFRKPRVSRTASVPSSPAKPFADSLILNPAPMLHHQPMQTDSPIPVPSDIGIHPPSDTSNGIDALIAGLVDSQESMMAHPQSDVIEVPQHLADM